MFKHSFKTFFKTYFKNILKIFLNIFNFLNHVFLLQYIFWRWSDLYEVSSVSLRIHVPHHSLSVDRGLTNGRSLRVGKPSLYIKHSFIFKTYV